MSILGPIFNMLLKCDKVMHGEQNLILSLSIICFILICAAVSGRDYICQSQFLVCLCSPHCTSPKLIYMSDPEGTPLLPIPEDRRNKGTCLRCLLAC